MPMIFMNIILCLGVLFAESAWADDLKPMMPPSSSENEASFHQRKSEFSLLREPDRPRNYWLPPLVSIVFPGFDQWYEGQYAYALMYTGGSTAASLIGMANATSGQYKSESEERYYNRATQGVKERRSQLGWQTYQAIGGLSAYHSFRTAVRSHHSTGGFSFLSEEESMTDLLSAPFRFKYLLRPSTFIPLTVGVAVNALIYQSLKTSSKDYETDALSEPDVVFASAISYNAGTHEEAVFRGWVMPMFMQWTDSPFWSNTITNAVFASLHLSAENPLPWPQFFLGWHLGYVTQKNHWTIGESIFIHTWWDVLAFITQYQLKLKEDDSGSRIKVEPALHLPPFELNF
jgi:membrane protease YdiL (CAAX protease family)